MIRLLDASVWISVFREDAAVIRGLARLDEPDEAEVVTCGPVRMELLQGALPTEYPRVRDALDRARSIPVLENDFDLAASIYRSVRARGHTVRSGLDCLIAAVAFRSEATLVHRDVDFTRIAEAVPDLTMIDLTA